MMTILIPRSQHLKISLHAEFPGTKNCLRQMRAVPAEAKKVGALRNLRHRCRGYRCRRPTPEA
ncbi:hypothetical protein LguiA_016752 [Lonicera macranthoides]